MFSKLKDIYHIFTCEKYTELASRAMDSKLSVFDNFMYKIHHFMCTFCRRSTRQIHVIEQVSKKLEADGLLSAQQEMPDSVKLRIKESLSKAANKDH